MTPPPPSLWGRISRAIKDGAGNNAVLNDANNVNPGPVLQRSASIRSTFGWLLPYARWAEAWTASLAKCRENALPE